MVCTVVASGGWGTEESALDQTEVLRDCCLPKVPNVPFCRSKQILHDIYKTERNGNAVAGTLAQKHLSEWAQPVFFAVARGQWRMLHFHATATTFASD